MLITAVFYFRVFYLLCKKYFEKHKTLRTFVFKILEKLSIVSSDKEETFVYPAQLTKIEKFFEENNSCNYFAVYS